MLPAELTFTGDREEYQTARLANVRRHQLLDKTNVGLPSTLANASDQTFPNASSPTVKQR